MYTVVFDGSIYFPFPVPRRVRVKVSIGQYFGNLKTSGAQLHSFFTSYSSPFFVILQPHTSTLG